MPSGRTGWKPVFRPACDFLDALEARRGHLFFSLGNHLVFDAFVVALNEHRMEENWR